MLWTIAVVLLLLWALGLVSATTMGGFIHVLLVAAIVLCSSASFRDAADRGSLTLRRRDLRCTTE